MKQLHEQPIESVQDSKNIWIIVVTIIVTALIAGGSIYAWQILNFKSTEQNIQQQIFVLQNQINQLQQTQNNQNKQDNQPSVNQNDYSNESTSIPTQQSYEFTFTNKNNFPIDQKQFNILQHFRINNLESKSQKCGTNKSQTYFKNLLSKFSSNDKGHIYKISYPDQTQGLSIWKITVIPNKLGYKNLDEFKNDFDLCYIGGDEYPILVSENYLLFASSCGSGFDDESNLPHGCDLIRESIQPTIILK